MLRVDLEPQANQTGVKQALQPTCPRSPLFATEASQKALGAQGAEQISLSDIPPRPELVPDRHLLKSPLVVDPDDMASTPPVLSCPAAGVQKENPGSKHSFVQARPQLPVPVIPSVLACGRCFNPSFSHCTGSVFCRLGRVLDVPATNSDRIGRRA